MLSRETEDRKHTATAVAAQRSSTCSRVLDGSHSETRLAAAHRRGTVIFDGVAGVRLFGFESKKTEKDI